MQYLYFKIVSKGSFVITEGVKLELPSMNIPKVNRRIRYIPSYNFISDDLNIIAYDGRLIKNPVVAVSFNKTGTKKRKNSTTLIKTLLQNLFLSHLQNT